VLGLALGIALSNSIARVVDDVVPGHSEAGLRVVLALAAAIALAGVPVARMAESRRADAADAPAVPGAR
jgi:hypothetical protein